MAGRVKRKAKVLENEEMLNSERAQELRSAASAAEYEKIQNQVRSETADLKVSLQTPSPKSHDTMQKPDEGA